MRSRDRAAKEPPGIDIALLLAAEFFAAAVLLSGIVPRLDVLRAYWPAAVLALGILLVIRILSARPRNGWGTRWSALGILVLTAAVLVAFDTPLAAKPATSQPTFRIVAFNLNKDTRIGGHVADWITRESPDVIALFEARTHPALLKALATDYPHRIGCRYPARHCSTILFSRHAPIRAEGLAEGDADDRKTLSAARISVCFENRVVDIVGVHMPRGYQQTKRMRDMRHLTTALNDRTAPTVTVGDFNAAPAAADLQIIAAETGLGRVPIGGNTWPSVASLGGIIPLDQAYVSKDTLRAEGRVGPHLGSDHRPIVVDVALASDGPGTVCTSSEDAAANTER